MKWSVQRLLAWGFGLAVVVCLAFGGLAYRTTQNSIETNRMVSHTHQVLRVLESILAVLEEAETTQRGYLITLDQSYLDQNRRALAKVETDVAQLKNLVKNDAAQLQRVPRLEQLIEARFILLNETLHARQTKGFEAARDLLLTGKGKVAMDEIRVFIKEMSEAENDLLSVRSAKSKAANDRTIAAFLTLIGVVLVLLLLLYFVVRSDLVTRRQAQAEMLKARDAALESTRLKSEFLATMSHEIRTPMNGVIGMSNLLLDTPLDKEQREFAETIRNSADTLLTIINDILDFSKIEAGKLHFETADFDLNAAGEGAGDLVAGRAHEKGMELGILIEADVPLFLRGDAGRLRQVLTNLLGNAVKFTERGEVLLRVEKKQEDSGSVVLHFSVSDTGIGLSKEAISRLFQPFSQADSSTTRKYGGTGLGLAIARQLIEKMNGTIGVESEPGKGATFWFTARFEKQASQSPHSALKAESLAGLRVLIVDDNETNRKILHHQLSAWRMLNESVPDGPGALRLLRARADDGQPFHVAVLDMQMPDMDGLELAKRIKSDPAISATRLILLSSIGHRLPQAIMEVAGIGASLVKPVKQSHLFDCLSTLAAETSSQLPPAHNKTELTPSTAPQFSRRKLRVLLAEDNVVNQKVAVKQLQRLGYTVDVAANGHEVFDALGRADYDLILMDCQMPEMDGYEAAAKIRQLETRQMNSVGQKRRMPIIAMTANAMEGDREKCLAAGMDDYISKPVRAEELDRKIQALISKKEPFPDQA